MGQNAGVTEQTITVIGQGAARATPKGVALTLVVRASGDDPQEALRRAVDRSHALEAILRDHRVPESAWTTIVTSLSANRRWVEQREEERLIGYTATGGLTVELDDHGQAGPVMAEAAGKAGADIMGPQWRIDPDDPGWREARTRAVEDARRRATDYAEGLGLQLGSVVTVSEPVRGPMRGRSPVAAYAAAGAESEGFGLHAGGLELAVSVEVTFRLAPA
jgi:uncharacterized protein YggE